MTTPLLNFDIHVNGNKKPFLSFRGGKNKPIKLEFKMANLANLTNDQVDTIIKAIMTSVDGELENLDETKLTKEQIEAIINSALKNQMA